MKINFNINADINWEKTVNTLYAFFGITYIRIMKKYNVLPFRDFENKPIPAGAMVYADPDWTTNIMIATKKTNTWVNKLDILTIKKTIKRLRND